MTTHRLLSLLLPVCLAAAPAVAAPPASNEQMAALGPIYPAVRTAERKIVYFGYNAPPARWIGAHADALDASGIDGTGYYVEFPDPDNQRSTSGQQSRTSIRLFETQTRWDPAWFEEPLAAMRDAELKNATQNHLMAWVTPAEFDWFDDAAWDTVLHNTRLLARFGRDTGVTRGINFDAEQYEGQLWHHSVLENGRSFAETAAKVRERGQSFVEAIGGEWPGAELLLFWISDYARPGLGAADDPARAGETTGLFLAFFEGMLAGMPEEMTVWEGNEHAYMFGSPASFPRTAMRVRSDLAAALSPELRRRFYAHVRQSHGVYLDAYLNDEGTQYGISKFGKTPSDLLFRNTLSALSTSDGLVWLWAEDGVFFEGGGLGYAGDRITQPRWDERFGFLHEAMDWARRPHAKLAANLDRVAEVFADEAFLASADMQPVETSADEPQGEGWQSGDLPGSWWSWKYDDDPGTFAYDREAGRGDDRSLRMDGIAMGGCFGVTLPTTPQRTILVRAHAKVEGDAQPLLTIRWRHPGEAFDMAGEDVSVAFEPAGPDGWRRAFAVVTAPEQVSSAVVLLSSTGEPDSVVRFDDVQAWDFTAGPARLWEAAE